MKVVYYSYSFFADCDFPLIKALQSKGIDIHYYMPLPRNFQRSSILEFKKPVKKIGFVKASTMDDMEVYKDCLDLNRLYFIKGFPKSKYWIPSWILWIYTLFHIKRQKADIIHIDWQFSSHFEKFLFKFLRGAKKVMTVHDPLSHSGVANSELKEVRRIESFRWADVFILLNKIQSSEFSKKYGICKDKLFFSRLGSYTSISWVTPTPSTVMENYILFFGQITPHKGIEYLVESMIKVHELYPKLKLVIAGGGKIYFDVRKYQNANYIEWRNYYIGISELVGLVKDCKFVVCPYKDATQSGVIQTAFALEKPVIATNVGNMPLVVKNEETGLIISPCDSESLKEAILRLIGNQQLLDFFVDNIKKYNKEDNSWNKIAEDYINAYVSVLRFT